MNLYWKDHPRLRGRWHPERPDQLRVLLHDGGPHTAKAPPEVHTVRVTGRRGQVFYGSVLSQPRRLTRTRVGDRISFLVPRVAPHPIQVREEYLAERRQWSWQPCRRCGFSELFDPPSQLLGRPSAQQQPPWRCATPCPLCGGRVLLERNPASRRLRRRPQPGSRARAATEGPPARARPPARTPVALAPRTPDVKTAARPILSVPRRPSQRWVAMQPVSLPAPVEPRHEPPPLAEPAATPWFLKLARGPLGDFVYWSTIAWPFPTVMLAYPVNILVSFLALTVCFAWLLFLTSLHGFCQRRLVCAEARGWQGRAWVAARCLLDLFEPRWDVGLTLRSLLRG